MTALRQEAINILENIPDQNLQKAVVFLHSLSNEDKKNENGKNTVKLGLAKGKYKCPKNFYTNDPEIAAMFGDQ